MSNLTSALQNFSHNISYSSDALEPSDLHAFNRELIPKRIKNIVGDIVEIVPQGDANCNLVLLVHGEAGRFILKIAHGAFRTDQLQYEYTIMREVSRSFTKLPLAKAMAFAKKDPYAFLLQSYIEGAPISDTLTDRHLLAQVARNLHDIHSFQLDDLDYDKILSDQLWAAEQNMRHNLLDPDEFKGIGNPEDILKALNTNRPSGSNPVLLHGDYRPKNILHRQGKVMGIIDWGFCMPGDAYYDLSIMLWYLKDEALKQNFVQEYGLRSGLDPVRLEYFDLLSKFLNV